jgi:uncharacterized protein
MSGVSTATTSAEEMAVAFARVLRGVGISAPTGMVLTFAQALSLTGVDQRDAVYWAGRTSLIRRPEDRDLYDRAFAVFWEHRRGGGDPDEAQPPQMLTLAIDDDDDGHDDGGDAEATERDDDMITLRFSAVEVLRTKDFADYTPDELVQCQQLMSQLRLAGPPRRSLRLQPSRGRGRRPDLRRTVRASMAVGGEPVMPRHKEPGERLRRLIVILDVSGSMEPYARALLRFVHAAVAGRQRVEAFALGTRLTRMTRELTTRDPDRALARAAEQVIDWSGGTRLGEGLRIFNDQWGVRGLARGAIVVVLSDGWDRGEPALLAEQMARLRRVAARIVWVNPLKVTPGYAPLARGMAAALPYVDDFVEGHSVAALDELAEVIARGGLR